VLGVLYMLYLAWHVLLSKPVEDGVERRDMNSFWGGFTLQFLNLKGILYGVTVFSIFIVLTYPDPLQAAAFAPALAGIAFIAITTWAVGGNLFRSLLARNYRLFNLVMAGLLVYTAVASLLH
jgi:cysteine/O-acetylserine efflux protein